MLSFWVHVQPGARATELVGMHGDAVKIRVRAAATEGRANEEVRAFVAGLLGISPSEVEIRIGEKARRKCLVVAERASDALSSLLEKVHGRT